jgi:glycerol-3-phosphate dehydrogenase
MTVGARAVDLAAGKLGRPGRRRAGDLRRRPVTSAPPGLDAALAGRLARTYGAAAGSIFEDLAENGALARRIAPEQPTTAAEVRHAIRDEMALSLADIVLRRTPLGTFGHPGRPVLESCAAIAGDTLAWDAARRAREIDLVEAEYRRLGAREAR